MSVSLERDCSARRCQMTDDRAQKRCFPDAITAEKAGDLSRLDSDRNFP